MEGAAPAPALRELVEFLARGVVERPEQVRVSEVEAEGAGDGAGGREGGGEGGGEGTIILRIEVAAEDVGKLIGRQGRIIQAIRTIARAAATRRGQRVSVEVRG